MAFDLSPRQQRLRVALRDPRLRPAIEAHLDAWFAQGLTRDTAPAWREEPAWIAAAWMFKRGFHAYSTADDGVMPAAEAFRDPHHTSSLHTRAQAMNTRVQVLGIESFREALSLPASDPLAHWIVDEKLSAPIVSLVRPRGSLSFVHAREELKTLSTAWQLLDEVPKTARRIIAFGGGLTSDLAGFVAAMAGIRFDAVATTILSAVDAGIGGKTGVNHASGKNQIGAFHPLETLWCCPELFATLPTQERASGACEALKHAWLAGMEPVGLEWGSFLDPSSTSLIPAPFLHALIQVKQRVVSADPFELGVRVLLNFGHGFGHALEALALRNASILPHGIAIGWGMVAKFRTLLRDSPHAAHYLSILEELLPQTSAIPAAPAHALAPLLAQDKKAAQDKTLPLVIPPFGGLEAVLSGGAALESMLAYLSPAAAAALLEDALSAH